jgi:hypothetical protein
MSKSFKANKGENYPNLLRYQVDVKHKLLKNLDIHLGLFLRLVSI